jgi:hypothetical protein
MGENEKMNETKGRNNTETNKAGTKKTSHGDADQIAKMRRIKAHRLQSDRQQCKRFRFKRYRLYKHIIADQITIKAAKSHACP